MQPQVEIPTLGNTSAPVEPTPEVSTEDEEIHDSETSETHEAESLKAHKSDETIGNIVQSIPLFLFLPKQHLSLVLIIIYFIENR